MAAKKPEPASGPSSSRHGGHKQGSSPNEATASRPGVDVLALQTVEEWQRTFDAVSDPLTVIDTQYRIVRANKAMADRLGLPKEQCVGQTCYRLVHGADEPPSFCPHAGLLQDGEEHTVEVHEERLAGDFFVSVFPLRDSTACLVGSVHVAHDITEQKRAEKALRDSESRYRSLVETAQEGIGIVDPDENIVFVNQAYADLLGYRKEELLGLNLSELADEAEFAKYREETQQRREGKSSRYETMLRHKTGGARYFGVSASPLLDDRGNSIGTMGLLTDITERKRAEERLRQERDRAEMYLDIAGVILVALDADGRVARLNRKGCEILGVIQEHVMGKPWCDEFVPVRDRQRTKQCLAALIAGHLELTEYFENAVLTKEGEEREIAWHNRLLRDDQGVIVGTLSSGEDITECNRAQEALRRSEKMQAEAEELAATGRMAARVAHEINNPLAGIKNSFRLIRDAVPEDHPDHDMVERIEREIDRISHIVRQMYTLSSPRGEKTADVVVADAIWDVLLMLEPIRREHEVQLEQSCTPTGLTVRIAEGGLHQIVYNLTANAIEASPRGGIVTVAAKLADDNNDEHDLVEITVRDQGEGIPAKIQPRIFEPFCTAKSHGDSGKGLGLGLSVVRSIVEAHGGSIALESTPGQGTVFRVFLPHNPKAKEQ